MIELDEPLEETVCLKYTLKEQGKVTLYMTQEYVLNVEMEAVSPVDTTAPQVVVSVINSVGKSLLESQDTNKKVNIYIEGEKIDYTIEQGKAVIFYPVEDSRQVEVRVGFEQLEGRVFCNRLVDMIWLEKSEMEIVEEEEEETYVLLYAVIAGVCFAFLLSLYLLISAKKKTDKAAKDSAESQGAGETSKYDFSGQMVVYMLKNPMGEDIPPASINLYLRESREPFSFACIKDNCQITMALIDADKIQFRGGAGHTLCVKNSGEATVIHGKEILSGRQKCVLHYNEKILLIFNSGDVEIEIYYKNMKPSERKR